MHTQFPNPEVLGTFHQFGSFDVPYQVLKPTRGQLKAGWSR